MDSPGCQLEMAIEQFKDVEAGEINGLEDLKKPLIAEEQNVVHENDHETAKSNDESGPIWMVLLCTFVAVCGSFEFGSCVSTLILLLL